MKRKISRILMIMAILLTPFLILLSNNNKIENINYPSFKSSFSKDNSKIPTNLEEKTFTEIKKNQANGTRDTLNINQTVGSNKTELNWLVQNDGGLASPPAPQVPVGDVSKDFNITGVDNYNRTFRKVIIQNVSAEPSWKDIEENTTLLNAGTNRLELADTGTIYQCGAMEFNLTEDSRVTNISWYGRVIDGAIPSNEWYVEIWNRTGQWQGAPDTSLAKITKNSTDPIGWTTHTFNLNLTAGSYFFVINGSNLNILIDGDLIYWAKIPDSGAGTDGADDGDVYVYSGGWGTPFPTFDVSLKVQTVPIDASNDPLTNINPEDFDMNMTIDSVVYDINSTTNSIEFSNLNEIGNKSVTITANHSFSCNLTWTTFNFNITETTLVNYNVSSSQNLANWMFNYTVNIPTPTFGESCSNYDISIIKPNPSWNLVTALNSSNLNVTAGIIEDNIKIYLSNNTQPILTNGEWKFTCQNLAQIILLSMNQSTITTLYHPQAFIHGEVIQLNATILGFSDGYANLTVYNTTNDDITSNWISVDSIDISTFGYGLFNLTVPSSASKGNYTIQTVWSNNTYAGINQTYVLVINDTSIRLLNENEITGIQLLHEDINLTVYFNDTHSYAPITGANITFKILNVSAGYTLVIQDNITYSGSPGYYNYTISTDNFVNGTYQIIINASKEWCNNVTESRTFDLVYNTSLTRILPINDTTSNYDPFNLTIKVRYFEWETGVNITFSTVNFTTNSTPGPGQNGTLNWQGADQTYNIQLNYTDYTLNNTYEINITATKQGYLTQMFTIYWNLTQDVINPTVIIDSPVNKLNSSSTPVQVNWTSSYDLESGIRIYQVFRNGTSQYVGTSTVQNIVLPEGWNNITIVAEDYAGNNGTNWIWIIYDLHDPTINITAPAINENVSGSMISIEGFANGTGTEIYSVMINDSRFYLYTSPNGTLSGNYAFRNKTFLPDGYIGFEVNITDSAGRNSSNTGWFYVDNTPPILLGSSGNIQFEFGASNQEINWTWMEWAPDKYNITWVEGATVNKTGTYTDNTPITFNVTGLDNGVYTFRIGVNDTNGHSASNDIIVTVGDNTPPNLLSVTGNIVYNYEAVGPFVITWIWNETHPSGYNITWVQQGIINQTGSYTNGSAINFDVTGLNAGSYTFRCDVNDTSNNTAFRDVNVTVGKFPSTEVLLNITGVYNSTGILWGSEFGVNVTYKRLPGALIAEQGTANSNWTFPNNSHLVSFNNGHYIFIVPLNASNRPLIDQAGLWGINFTVDSNNFASAWANFTVNVTTLTHLNATDSSYNDYNNTMTYQRENGTIIIFYNDIVFDNPLDTYAVMTNWTNGYWTQSLSGGYYDIALNTIGVAPGNYKVKINASASYYQFQEIIVNITINPKFNISIFNYNNTIKNEYNFGEKINITIQILNGSTPVANLPINITINATTPFTIVGTTDANGFYIYDTYTISKDDVGKRLNITITFLEAFEYNLNSTSFLVTVKGEEEAFLFPPPLGAEGLPLWILFVIIGAVAVGIITTVSVIGARRRKARIEIEKKKTISSVADVANIRHILVIHKGTGIDIFNYEVEKGLDPTLISGFIQAVKGFGSELSRKAKEKRMSEE